MKQKTLATLSKVEQSVNSVAEFLAYIDDNYSEVLVKKIQQLAKKVNPEKHSDIFLFFFLELEKVKQEYTTKNIDTKWPADNWAYLYVDKFGVDAKGKATFKSLAKNLDYLSDLNIKNLYLLPINKSPKKDGGYDVSDYKEVDEAVGGNQGFKEFAQIASKKGFRIIIDFSPNHISEEHAWFKKALTGDKKYVNYFINTNNPPASKLVRYDRDYYIEYMDESGATYARILLFPDLIQKHWIKYTLGNKQSHYFYSSFFDFQKDLNNQNPDVIREHFSTLAFWLTHGVSGIRADAVGWWVKYPGHSGQHSPETHALNELIHIFMKEVEPNSLYLPEIVDTVDTALTYVGQPTVINGVPTATEADALFAFQKTVHMFYAGATGSFTPYYSFLKHQLHNCMPENTYEVFYTANHHDEIYLGFIEEEHKVKLQEKIQDAYGVLYKGGNSGGCRITDLLKNDPIQLYNFFKFFFAHKGAIAVFLGSELGVNNAWAHTYEVTINHLNEMKRKGDLPATHPVFKEIEQLKKQKGLLEKPAKKDAVIREFIDGRLLHRMPVTQKMLDVALDGKNKFYNWFKPLLLKRDKVSVLKYGSIEYPVDTFNANVAAFVRRHKDGNQLEEILIVKNGSDEKQKVNLGLEQLTKNKKFKLYELDYKKNFNYKLGHNGEYITIVLEPYETLWLKIKA